MRNSKPPKRPLGTTPAMERALRAQMAKSSVARKDDAIKEVPLTPVRGLMAIGRQAIASGLRGPVRPVNSKEIAEMARRYAEKDKSVLEDIGKLTQRQQQMIRDEIARQYRKVTPMDKVKTLAKKIDKKLDPANTGRPAAIGIGIDETTNPKTVQLQEVEIMKPKKYAVGGSLKPVPAGKKGLAKLPTEVRNKMGYMMGGGKLDMMYQNGGQNKPVLDRNMRLVSPSRQKLESAAAAQKTAQADKTFNRNARLNREAALTQERNTIKKYDPDALAAFDQKLKEMGYKVQQVKKMAQGGKLKKPGAPNPLNPTKDNNSYISNAVDMSPAVKKQMDALRQAMMYFTGVSPKNK
jgi:hypothetical protein